VNRCSCRRDTDVTAAKNFLPAVRIVHMVNSCAARIVLLHLLFSSPCITCLLAGPEIRAGGLQHCLQSVLRIQQYCCCKIYGSRHVMYQSRRLPRHAPGETPRVAHAHSMLLMFCGANCPSFSSHSARKSCSTSAAGCSSILKPHSHALLISTVSWMPL